MREMKCTWQDQDFNPVLINCEVCDYNYSEECLLVLWVLEFLSSS